MSGWFASSKQLQLGRSVSLFLFLLKDTFSELAPLIMEHIDAHSSPRCPLLPLP